MARKVRILLRWPQKILILMSTRRAACAGRAGGRFGNDSAIDSGGGEVRKPRKKRKSTSCLSSIPSTQPPTNPDL
ncbi:hypothetical protein M8J76_012528 [Diaphorina citri]|nr:hypothetical protein M8J76_012528 [Diaphorina citri]